MRLPTDAEIFEYHIGMGTLLMRALGPAVSISAGVVFHCIATKPDLTQVQISECAGLSKFAVHRAVKSLTVAKVVRTRIHQNDGRRKHVFLTKRGEKIRALFLSEAHARARKSLHSAGD